MVRLRRATSIVLLVLASGSTGCDLERWLHGGAADPPPALAEREAPPAPLAAASGTERREPLRIPEPPPAARSSYNKFSSAPKKPASAPSRPLTVVRAARDEILPGSPACEKARRDVARMESYVSSIEGEIEWIEDQAGDIRDTPRSRGYYEGRLAAAEQQLEQAENALSDYLDVQRAQGVPAGCLR